MTFSKSKYPAAHYALIIVDHGFGLSGVAKDYSVAPDQFLTNPELHVVLSEWGKLDILYMSVCLLGNLESEYQFRGTADYYVASESISYGNRKPSRYINTLTGFTSADTLAKNMAHGYYEDYKHWAGTISVVNLNLVENVAQKTSELASAIRAPGSGSYPEIWQITETSQLQRFDSHPDGINRIIDTGDTFVDLKHFAILASQELDSSSIKDAADQLVLALNDYVIDNYTWSGTFDTVQGHFEYNHANANGVAVAFPREFRLCFYTSEWLDFAGGVNWSCTGPQKESSPNETFEWGQLVADILASQNPSALEIITPPPPFPLITPYWSIYLPLIVRN